MKILVWGLILTFNVCAANAGASDPTNCAHCKKELKGKPISGDELGDIKQIAKHDNTKKMMLLAREICTIYNLSGMNMARDVKKAIKRHMKTEEGIKNPTGPQMLRFLNKNRHKMTCKSDGVEKNYMKYDFDRIIEVRVKINFQPVEI